MAFSVGSDLERGYLKIHILEFTIAFDLDIFLPDRKPLLLCLCFVDRGLQIEQQAFSSHLQNIEASSTRRELKIKAHVSTGLKDFHIVIYHHSDGNVSCYEHVIGLSA